MKILKSTHERITDEEEFINQIKEVSIPEWIESELPRLEGDKVFDNL